MDGLMMDEPLLLQTLLWRTERLFPAKQIITRLEPGRYHRYTYAEFAARVRRLSSVLEARLGVRFGDMVGTLAWNHYRHFELYYGVPGIGAVCHTVNLRLFPEQQRYIINHAGDKVLFLDPDQLKVVEEMARDGLPTVQAYIIMADGPLPETSLSPVYSYEELLAEGSESYELREDFDEHTAAAMCYTSATTGLPKGVMFSHRGLVLQTMIMATHDKLNLSEDQVWMEIAPMFHCNGWNLPHAVLLQGATLVLAGVHPLDRDYVQIIQDLKVTGMNAAVTIGTMMRDFILRSDKDWDLSSLRTMWLGGQAPPRAIMEWFGERYGTWVLQGYGQTESSPQIAFNHIRTTLRNGSPEEIWKLRQTGGIPLPLMKVKITGEDGSELPWDGVSIGDIMVRSPYTANGYYEDERTKEAVVDGWFRTGDMGAVTPEGFILVKDRSKDLIKSGGEWISSIDLENFLMAHPKVRESTVFAVPDEKWLERPVACVIPSDPSVTEDELREYLLSDFAKWWIPDRFLIVSAIPRTSVGKFDKKKLRGMVSEGGIQAIETELGMSAAMPVAE